MYKRAPVFVFCISIGKNYETAQIPFGNVTKETSKRCLSFAKRNHIQQRKQMFKDELQTLLKRENKIKENLNRNK